MKANLKLALTSELETPSERLVTTGRRREPKIRLHYFSTTGADSRGLQGNRGDYQTAGK
jgi:hypothetical protein